MDQSIKVISRFKANSAFARRLEGGGNYADLLQACQPGELLYALFDHLRTQEEIEAERAEIAALPPGSIGANCAPSVYDTVMICVENQAEFESQPWSRSGWVYFYAIPEWLAKWPTDY